MPLHPRPALISLLLLSLAGPVVAQDPPVPITDAAALPEMAAVEQAWQRGDFLFVRSALKQLAEEQGTALAQYRYGRVLLEGRGGPRDLNGAATWLQRAVDQDHLQATTLLARLYLSLTDAQRNPQQAARLLASAAARGDAEAQFYLALLTSSGDGVAKDEAAAVNWFLAAAEQQHGAAQYALSRAYAQGAGTPKNPEKALRWLRQAAENGHVDAQFYLALAYDRGQGVPQTPAEALRWYRSASEAGHKLAQRTLGTKYLQGEGTPVDLSAALHWLTLAAEAGEPGAMSNLGYLYARGHGVEQDNTQAAFWYEQAADHGIGRAMFALARFHEIGRGVEQDLTRAVQLYQQAASQEVPGAAARLVALALDGTLDDQLAPHQMVPWMAIEARTGNAAAETWLNIQAQAELRPAQTALALLQLDRGDAPTGPANLLEQAARSGDPAAQLRLGTLYTTGTGVSLDYVQAHAWLNVAAANGLDAAAEQRDLIAQLMTPDQVAKAQDRARAFFDEAASRPPQVTR